MSSIYGETDVNNKLQNKVTNTYKPHEKCYTFIVLIFPERCKFIYIVHFIADWSLEAVTIDCTRLAFLRALVLAGLSNYIVHTHPGNTPQTDTAFAFVLGNTGS